MVDSSQYVAFGLMDSINPGMMTIILFFIMLLFWNGSQRGQLIVTAIFYVGAVLVMSVLLGLGGMAEVVASDFFLRFCQVAYVVIAICFLAAGVVSFRDWWIYRRTLEPQRLMTVRKRETRKAGFLFLFRSVFSVSTAVVLSLLATVFPPYSDMPPMIYILVAKGLRIQAAANMIVYSTGYVLPLLALVAVWLILLRESGRNISVMSKSLIVSSAAFLACGAGLLYMFLI